MEKVKTEVYLVAMHISQETDYKIDALFFCSLDESEPLEEGVMKIENHIPGDGLKKRSVPIYG